MLRETMTTSCKASGWSIMTSASDRESAMPLRMFASSIPRERVAVCFETDAATPATS